MEDNKEFKNNNPSETDLNENVENTEKKNSKKEEKNNIKASELQKKLNEITEEKDNLCKELKEIKAKVEDTNDKYLRLAAEYDNYRRRTAKEKEDTYNIAYGEALNEFLPMIDNLERSLNYGTNDKVIDGIKLIMTQFEQMLQKMGIETYGKVGDQFDPSIHNAVFHVEDEKLEENVIVDVLVKGYKRGDKILRFAMVKVAN